MIPSSDVLIIVILAIVVLTLSSFVYVQYVNYNSKAANWNLLNLMAGITIALTLNSIMPQLFLIGRTEAECNFLHHWSGSFYNLTNGLARLFFQCRSNQIAPDTKRDAFIGNVMAGVIVFLTLFAIITNNLSMTTMVVPPLNLCVGIPDMFGALLMVLILPMIVDISINVRFFSHVIDSTRQVTGAAARSHNKAPLRLLKVTCLLSISCTAMSFICMLFLSGFLPLENRAWITVILAGEQAYNACAMAWPSIYVFARKRAKAYLQMTFTRTDKTKTNDLKSTVKQPTIGDESTHVSSRQ